MGPWSAWLWGIGSATAMGLNLVRLLLASVVLANHCWPLGGYGFGQIGPWVPRELAVDGFFAISGYLILSSRLSVSAGRFLWHRFLRLFPALWVCLLLTAGAGAVMGGTGVARYLIPNAVLYTQYVIPGSLDHVPYGPTWNGSLWTLTYEAGCYLVVLVLFRRPRPALTAAAAVALAVADLGYWSTLGGLFAAGSTVYLLRDRLPDSGLLASLSALLVLLAAPVHLTLLLVFPMAYLALWLGAHLPDVGISERRDLSYGVYIYGFPVTQVLASLGLHHRPLLFGPATVLLTFSLAALSRVLVENPCRALKNLRLVRADRDSCALAVHDEKRPHLRVAQSLDLERAVASNAPARTVW